MEESDTPYVFRDEREAVDGDGTVDPEGADVVIVEGRAMSYRRYRGGA